MCSLPVAKLLLRAIEVICALIAWACAAYLIDKGFDRSQVNFMMFTAFTAFLVAIFYIIVSFVQRLQDIFSGLVEMIVNFIYFIFFMAAFGAYFDMAVCEPGEFGHGGKPCQAFLTSAAFSIFSWLLWGIHVVLAFFDFRSGKGVGGNPRGPSTYTGSAPAMEIA